MTIDERLEKLRERHEALTQTVEILTADINTQRRTMDDLMAGFSILSEIQRLNRLEGR
jgi:archaellum component FlaC